MFIQLFRFFFGVYCIILAACMSSPSLTLALCRHATLRVTKAIRFYDLEKVEDLLRETDIKLIALFRDPRAVQRSRGR